MLHTFFSLLCVLLISSLTQAMNPTVQLIEGVWKGNLKQVKEAYCSGAESNIKIEQFQNKTPLMLAISKRHKDIVEYLITTAHADVNALDIINYTPLLHAIDSLVSYRLHHEQSHENDREILKLLIKARADVNALDPDGNSALQSFARQGETELIELILKAGAHVNQPNSTGYTPLMAAIGGNHLRIALILILQGATVDAQTEYGETALIQCRKK